MEDNSSPSEAPAPVAPAPVVTVAESEARYRSVISQARDFLKQHTRASAKEDKYEDKYDFCSYIVNSLAAYDEDAIHHGYNSSALVRGGAKHASGEKHSAAGTSLIKDSIKEHKDAVKEQRALKAAKEAEERAFKRELASWNYLRLDTSAPGMSQRVYQARRQLWAEQQAKNFPPLKASKKN